MESSSPFAAEWQLLQSQYHDYERHALYLKVFGFILLAIALVNNAPPIMACIVFALVWLQEAIWRTFQSRVQNRIVTLEKAIAGNDNNQQLAFQHHSQFLANKPGIVGLFGQYLKHALAPTVAFPHAIFVIGYALLAG